MKTLLWRSRWAWGISSCFIHPWTVDLADSAISLTLVQVANATITKRTTAASVNAREHHAALERLPTDEPGRTRDEGRLIFGSLRMVTPPSPFPGKQDSCRSTQRALLFQLFRRNHPENARGPLATDRLPRRQNPVMEVDLEAKE